MRTCALPQDKKGKHFNPDFKVEVFLHRVETDDSEIKQKLVAPDSAAIRVAAGVARGQPIPDEWFTSPAGMAWLSGGQ